MAKEQPLTLKLYVIDREAYQGPIRLDTFQHHKPRMLTDIPQIFNAGPGNYLIYRAKSRDFVELDKTYNEIGIKNDESILMTQIYDLDANIAFYTAVLSNPKSQESFFESLPEIEAVVSLEGLSLSLDVIAWMKALYRKIAK